MSKRNPPFSTPTDNTDRKFYTAMRATYAYSAGMHGKVGFPSRAPVRNSTSYTASTRTRANAVSATSSAMATDLWRVMSDEVKTRNSTEYKKQR